MRKSVGIVPFLVIMVSFTAFISTVYASAKAAGPDAAKAGALSVPIENQNAGSEPLGNGCEITALSMILNYYGYQTDKNTLAEELTYVPLYEDEAADIHGDPREGFVGEISGGYDAMGVMVEPVAEVAEKIVEDEFTVHASTETELSELLQLVAEGTPVYAGVTVDFEVPQEEDFKVWQTNNGAVTVSPLNHAVVITGSDEHYVYVNDPYGYQNRSVDREVFEEIFEAMGRQSLYLMQKTKS